MILSSFAWYFISRSHSTLQRRLRDIIPILQMGEKYREDDLSSFWIIEQIRGKDRNKTGLLACALSRRRSAYIELVTSCYAGPQ